MTTQSQDGLTPIRVLVADDQRLMRDGIASLLKLQPGIEVVGTVANGEEALEQAAALLPDVILMDIRMPVMDGVEATAEVHVRLPGCKVLMLTTFDDDEYVADALRAGASGYLLKNIPAEDLAQAVRAAHRGIYQIDPSVAGRMVAALAGYGQAGLSDQVEGVPQKLSGLTRREIEVLRLVARGATNREIAEQLVIGEGTVKTHISSILARLDLRDRTQAALYAREAGLI